MKADTRSIYGDIVYLPHHQNPNGRRMSLYDRAAQFAPFAALSGYDDMVKEEARLTDEEIILSDYGKEILDRKLSLINDLLANGDNPKINVIYFKPDSLKSGGAYCSITAYVKNVDMVWRKLIFYGSDDIVSKKIKPVSIDLERIIDIRSELTDFLNE